MSIEQLDFFNASGDGVGAPPISRGGHLWAKPETLMLQDYLRRGELGRALETLGALKLVEARAVLTEAGFNPSNINSREIVMRSVQDSLILAAGGNTIQPQFGKTVTSQKREPISNVAPDSFVAAVTALQKIMSASNVEVGLAGAEPIEQRGSLKFLAAQALERQVSGFGIDGVQGKFKLPDNVSLRDLKTLNATAGREFAESEVRALIPAWANGKNVQRVSELVPESTAVMLRGNVTLQNAKGVQKAVESGDIAEFGGKKAVIVASQILAAQSINLNAPTLEELAANAQLKIAQPDMKRGQYVGPVLANDHRSSLIKVSRESALIILNKDVPSDIAFTKGDTVRVKFSNEKMNILVQPKTQDRAVSMQR